MKRKISKCHDMKKGFHKYSMKILLRWWSEEKQLCSSYEVQLFRNVMQIMYYREKGVTECKDDFLDGIHECFDKLKQQFTVIKCCFDRLRCRLIWGKWLLKIFLGAIRGQDVSRLVDLLFIKSPGVLQRRVGYLRWELVLLNLKPWFLVEKR